ncbi:hypothetical protein M413DRAFT_27415 [Hebeloma cylindrosporum]|uniref:Uncharacterized protein n=1 Tax=Hebeloma cylindrosporum TaxID=76867 RepID=A0A0C3CE11_HEBCY|nr:hypothetical protein M413DRAFT_27415 [Hebeloma cylindrosporum h7]
MTQQEYDAKYPGQISGLPPSPTIENPGRVFPPSDPKRGPFVSPRRTATPEQFVGNPFLMSSALDKLDHAFGEVMLILEQEATTQGRAIAGNPLYDKMMSWRDELEKMRLGEEELPDTLDRTPPTEGQEGGMFTD